MTTKDEINIKFLKRQSGLLSQFIICDLVIDLYNRSEIPFIQFDAGIEVDLEGEKFITVGMLLTEQSVEDLKTGYFNFLLQLGVFNEEENSIEHGPTMSVSLKLTDMIKVDSGKWNKEVSYTMLETVILFNKIHALSRINSLSKLYQSQTPRVI